MKIWQLMTRRLKKYKKWPILRSRMKNDENLVTYDKETIFIPFLWFVYKGFSYFPNSHTFSVSKPDLVPWYCNYNIDVWPSKKEKYLSLEFVLQKLIDAILYQLNCQLNTLCLGRKYWGKLSYQFITLFEANYRNAQCC